MVQWDPSTMTLLILWSKMKPLYLYWKIKAPQMKRWRPTLPQKILMLASSSPSPMEPHSKDFLMNLIPNFTRKRWRNFTTSSWLASPISKTFSGRPWWEPYSRTPSFSATLGHRNRGEDGIFFYFIPQFKYKYFLPAKKHQKTNPTFPPSL